MPSTPNLFDLRVHRGLVGREAPIAVAAVTLERLQMVEGNRAHPPVGQRACLEDFPARVELVPCLARHGKETVVPFRERIVAIHEHLSFLHIEIQPQKAHIGGEPLPELESTQALAANNASEGAKRRWNRYMISVYFDGDLTGGSTKCEVVIID